MIDGIIDILEALVHTVGKNIEEIMEKNGISDEKAIYLYRDW